MKGLAGADCDEAEEVVRESWRRSLKRHGSSFEAWRVSVARLRTPAGALHYLSLHHAKAEQLPPDGWRGMVERHSRGYFSQPVRELREEARSQLWVEALAYSTGLSADDARLLVDGERAKRAKWREINRQWRAEARWEPAPAPAPDVSPSPSPAALFGDDDIPF